MSISRAFLSCPCCHPLLCHLDLTLLIEFTDLQTTYSNYKNTLQQIASKIGDIEQEAEEHKFVLPSTFLPSLFCYFLISFALGYQPPRFQAMFHPFPVYAAHFQPQRDSMYHTANSATILGLCLRLWSRFRGIESVSA